MSIELHFGCQFLKSKQRLTILLKILTESSKKIIIIQEETDDPSIRMIYNRLKLVTQTPKMQQSIFSLKIWTESEVLTPLMLLKGGINLIFLEEGGNKLQFLECSHVIFLQHAEELKDILEMSIFQLQRRCKMERVMRVSQMKNIGQESMLKVQKIALKYTKQHQTQSMKVILKFMRYNTKWYLFKLRKCFNLWAIESYERGIDRVNENIINQEYFCRKYNRNLVKRGFTSWMMMVGMRKL